MLDPQSLHKYLYAHGDPVQGVDPTGMFSIGASLTSIGIQLAAIAIPGPEDFILSSYQSLLNAYAVNLEWDVDWAFDLELDDSLHSRNDDTWVLHALLSGIHSTFDISIPFTNISFNPLDPFVVKAFFGPSAAKKLDAGGSVFSFSSRKSLTTALGVTHHVKFFKSPKFRFPVVKFPNTAIRKEVKISPNGGGDIGRKLDIAAANKKLGKPIDYDWKAEYGEPHTWHHDTRRGIMQLVPRKLHQKSLPHVGGNELWYI